MVKGLVLAGNKKEVMIMLNDLIERFGKKTTIGDVCKAYDKNVLKMVSVK